MLLSNSSLDLQDIRVCFQKSCLSTVPVKAVFSNYRKVFSATELQNFVVLLFTLLFCHSLTPLPYAGQPVIVAIGRSFTDVAEIVIFPVLVNGREYP